MWGYTNINADQAAAIIMIVASFAWLAVSLLRTFFKD